MRKLRTVLLLLLPLVLLGGSTVYLGQSENRVIYSWGFTDNAFTEDDSTCYPNRVAFTGTGDARALCYVPLGRTLILEEFGVTASDALTVNEDCQIVLETTSDGTAAAGTDIASSVIEVGDDNANSGQCGDVTIDGRGDACLRVLDGSEATTSISGGGWWAVTFHEGSDAATCGGNCTCTTLEGVGIHVLGHYE